MQTAIKSVQYAIGYFCWPQILIFFIFGCIRKGIFMAEPKKYYVNKRTVHHGNVHLYRSSFLRLPDGIVGIEAGTFADFKKLKSIVFPNSLQYISAHAFHSCSGLKSIELPSRVSRIGAEAFRECKNLESAVLSVSLVAIPDRLFSDDGKLQELYIPANSRLHSVGVNAFFKCTRLSSLFLPDGVTIIEDAAFFTCKKMRQFHFPSRLKQIGEHAFHYCLLSEVVLPEGLEYIGAAAFYHCPQLTHVEIPASVRYIGNRAFKGSQKMKVLELRHDPDYIGPDVANHDTLIRCYQGSTVEEYCKRNGYAVSYL